MRVKPPHSTAPRSTGAYSALRARAGEKQQLLAARGLENPGVADTGLSLEAVMTWYFGRLDWPVPKDLYRYARAAGFIGAPALLRAVLREYFFVRSHTA